jgi:hypothetical protein
MAAHFRRGLAIPESIGPPSLLNPTQALAMERTRSRTGTRFTIIYIIDRGTPYQKKNEGAPYIGGRLGGRDELAWPATHFLTSTWVPSIDPTPRHEYQLRGRRCASSCRAKRAFRHGTFRNPARVVLTSNALPDEQLGWFNRLHTSERVPAACSPRKSRPQGVLCIYRGSATYPRSPSGTRRTC